MALKLPSPPLLWMVRDTACLSRLLLPKTRCAGLASKVKTRQRDINVVELCTPVPGWGDKGAILQVPRGLMRNTLYPQGQAQYIPFRQAKQVVLSGRIQQRDPSFLKEVRKGKHGAGSTASSGESARDEDSQGPENAHAAPRLTNQESLELVEQLASSGFAFYKPINRPGKIDEWITGIPIFGSVSKREIVDRIKESVTHVKEASAIRLDESNVEILGREPEDEPLRTIKTTGQFTVAISYPGVGRKVYRDVAVRPEDGEPEAPSSSVLP